RRSQIKGVLIGIKCLFHPVHHMPTSIVAKVFEHHVPKLQGRTRIGVKQVPLSLYQVCWSWRKLFFAIPCLWKMVRIAFPASPPKW
ncbi:hypothetical protein PISMIDRAFT_108317, partial [Pisolithus microcarpus 441]